MQMQNKHEICCFIFISHSQTTKNSLSEIEKRERRAMERKLSELEEELKVITKVFPPYTQRKGKEKTKTANNKTVNVLCLYAVCVYSYFYFIFLKQFPVNGYRKAFSLRYRHDGNFFKGFSPTAFVL